MTCNVFGGTLNLAQSITSRVLCCEDYLCAARCVVPTLSSVLVTVLL